jgi:hypothetical protein
LRKGRFLAHSSRLKERDGAEIQKSGPVKEPTEQLEKEIRRATRRQFSADEKICIVLGGLRGEDSIAELRRPEPLLPLVEFLEAGKKRLVGDRRGRRPRTRSRICAGRLAC